MAVVTDAGPLRYLILIEASELIAQLYARLIVPTAVLNELSQPNTPPLVAQWMRKSPAWLEIRTVSVSERSFPR